MKKKAAYTLDFQQIDRTKVEIAGGKGANLGELARIAGIHVPDGFCIITAAFERIIGETPAVSALLDRLSQLKTTDRQQIRERSAEIRRRIENIVIPADIAGEITDRLTEYDETEAFAVRSSATAEDLPTASFAGQQDTFLNVIGKAPILEAVSKCWASLFTERAVTYRIQNGFDHRKVHLSVVVQRMIFPRAAGILFTADPVTSNRKTVSIDASFGLGEALVSGLVNADNYKVRDGRITDKKIPAKKLAVYPAKDGGTNRQEIAPEQQNTQALTDEQILRLAQIGRRIEAHFGTPQDIEWCIADDTFYMVQSRPITTLFPVPRMSPATAEDEKRVYVSVGHQQMMTDAMKPLGIAFWQLITSRPMAVAGGRLFVDITQQLASTAGRKTLIETLARSEPLIKDALTTIMQRDFIELLPDDDSMENPGKSHLTTDQPPIENDPAIVAGLIRRSEESMVAAKQRLRGKSGTDLFDGILESISGLKKILFDPQSIGVIVTAINAAAWINEKMNEWLGEKNAADTLALSVPDNVTSEMGLALLDVADAIRPYPEIVMQLQQLKNGHLVDRRVLAAELGRLDGGKKAVAAIDAYLDRYGMRCAGEIDITRTRWSENPAALIPVLLHHIKHLQPGESTRKFEQGRREALQKERELLHRLEQLPDGQQKAAETKAMIDRIRKFMGYREYPKYAWVSHYLVYKQALLKAAQQLVEAGVLQEIEDSYYLTFEELREAVRTQTLDNALIARRKEEYQIYEKLTPPRMITSEGEIVSGQYNREDLPAGAIAGLAVSSGVIEGRARVFLRMEETDLEEGDILVTSFTDPSWTPLFVAIKGLVTEVGGLMTHGAVIAREYGLPAVVGAENATKLIKDGQRIRVNGTNGYVELL